MTIYKEDERRHGLTVIRVLDGVGGSAGALATTDNGDAAFIAGKAVDLFSLAVGDRYEAKLVENRKNGSVEFFAARLYPTSDVMPGGLRAAVQTCLRDGEVWSIQELEAEACAAADIKDTAKNRAFVRSIAEQLYDDGVLRKALLLDRSETAKIWFSSAPPADLDLALFEDDEEPGTKAALALAAE